MAHGQNVPSCLSTTIQRWSQSKKIHKIQLGLIYNTQVKGGIKKKKKKEEDIALQSVTGLHNQ